MLALIVVVAALVVLRKGLGGQLSFDALRRWFIALIVCAVLLGGAAEFAKHFARLPTVAEPTVPPWLPVCLTIYVALAVLGWREWNRLRDPPPERRLRARRRALPEPPTRNGEHRAQGHRGPASIHGQT